MGGRACVRACVRVCINVGNVCGAVCAILLHGTFGFIIPINILYVYLYNILYTYKYTGKCYCTGYGVRVLYSYCVRALASHTDTAKRHT